MNYKEEYRKCAEICQGTDYGNKQSVCKHHKAVDRMYKIVEIVSVFGSEPAAELISLLDDEIASKWNAHHLAEKNKIDHKNEKRSQYKDLTPVLYSADNSIPKGHS